jgi:integrase
VAYLEILDRALATPRYSPHTRKAFLGQARRFLAAVGDKPDYSREDVLGYVDTLIRAGYRADSIGTILAAVRALFRENSLAWPVAERDLRLGLPQEEPIRPTLLVSEVMDLIAGVRGKVSIARITICLGTVWGLRADEIKRVLAAGGDGLRLEVQTAKGGRKRIHRVPDGLAPVMAFRPIVTSTRSLHTLFEGAMSAHVREPNPREGLHALRRTLVTALVEGGVDVVKIQRWMGWTLRESIVTTYYRPKPEALDADVYAAHPFLKYWTG